MKIFQTTISILFALLGVLNIWLIHSVPGNIYLLLAIFYLPYTQTQLQQLGIGIPKSIRIILAVLVLWGTLAVSDLVELLEGYMR